MATQTMAAPTGVTVNRSPENLPDVFAQATCLSLELSRLGDSKKVSMTEVSVNGEKSRYRVTKKIMESAELENIKATQGAVGRWLATRALPSGFFRRGFWLVPNTLLVDVDARLMIFSAQLDELVDKLCVAYEAIKEKDEMALGADFNAKDYLSVEDLRKEFSIRWQYISFGVARNLPENVMTREQDKARARLQEATDSIQQVLRGEMAKLVAHMADKLTAKEGEKKKIFRDSLVDNVREFLQVFNDRNITNDEELDALCDRARQLLDGVDPESLRKSDTTRARVAAGFADIKEKLDGMMQDAPFRKIEFGEEE